MSRKQIAALVGLAPYDFDSGKLRGHRSIYGGRMPVRNVLYIRGSGGEAGVQSLRAARRADAEHVERLLRQRQKPGPPRRNGVGPLRIDARPTARLL